VFIWVSLNNCYARVCHMILLVCGPVAALNVSVGAEVCCMAVGHHSEAFVLVNFSSDLDHSLL
jgi:hypothetical protein